MKEKAQPKYFLVATGQLDGDNHASLTSCSSVCSGDLTGATNL
jgi:hypothetical protein